MDWVYYIPAACGLILAVVLVQALRTGVLFTHRGPEIKRAERPGIFWTWFASYALILAACAWSTFAWGPW